LGTFLFNFFRNANIRKSAGQGSSAGEGSDEPFQNMC